MACRGPEAGLESAHAPSSQATLPRAKRSSAWQQQDMLSQKLSLDGFDFLTLSETVAAPLQKGKLGTS
jgi:hypothetical protein